ncbi:MAG: DUF2695 domain-containing protein [Pseudonocardia sp.]|nr:DUF2695 domain-containing protein [Pseudonocardia sp.]
MSIDDIPRTLPRSVDHWRAVMHDVVDQVLDEILDAAEEQRSDDLGDLLGDDCACGAFGPGCCPSAGAVPGDADGYGEPPGDPPFGTDVTALGTMLRGQLAAAIVDGTRLWGCDGTLRVTAEWTSGYGPLVGRVLDGMRRAGANCDCAVLHTVLGRTDVPLRCLLRVPTAGPPPEDP